MDENWLWFVNELRPLLKKSDGKIIAKLAAKFFSTPTSFQRSSEALDLLKSYISRIKKTPTGIYQILLELKFKLKNLEGYSREEYPITRRLRRDSSTDPNANSVVRRRLSLQTLRQETSRTLKRRHSGSESDGKLKSDIISLVDGESDDDDGGYRRPPFKRSHLEPSQSVNIDAENLKDNIKRNGLHKATSFVKYKRMPKDLQSLSLKQKTTSAPPSESGEQSQSRKAPASQNSASKELPRRHREARLRLLEQRMHVLSDKIQCLEETELDLDEMETENSSYMQLDRLKRQHMTLWKQYCQLKGISRHAASISRLPFVFNSSRYPPINKAVQRYMRKRINFPDFPDIYKLVARVSTQECLGLSDSEIDGLAREIFTEVGATLKQRREREFQHDFGCHLTDLEKINKEDPVRLDSSLERRLRANRRVANQNINSVFQKFCRLQEDIERSNEVIALVDDDDDDGDNQGACPEVEEVDEKNVDLDSPLCNEPGHISLLEANIEVPICPDVDEVPVSGPPDPTPVVSSVVIEEEEREKVADDDVKPGGVEEIVVKEPQLPEELGVVETTAEDIVQAVGEPRIPAEVEEVGDDDDDDDVEIVDCLIPKPPEMMTITRNKLVFETSLGGSVQVTSAHEKRVFEVHTSPSGGSRRLVPKSFERSVMQRQK